LSLLAALSHSRGVLVEAREALGGEREGEDEGGGERVEQGGVLGEAVHEGAALEVHDEDGDLLHVAHEEHDRVHDAGLELAVELHLVVGREVLLEEGKGEIVFIEHKEELGRAPWRSARPST
jgi:hypothetical protein